MASVGYNFGSSVPRMSLSQSPGTSSPAVVSPPIAASSSPPRRQTISSASEMPQKDIRAAVFSQHVASHQYVDHYRKSIEALRVQHREERAMWETERQELLLKVAKLEAQVTQLSRLQGTEVPSIADKLSKYSIGSAINSRSASAPSNTLSGSLSREQLLDSIGSAQSNPGHSEKIASKQHMDSIPEDIERTKSVSFAAVVDGPSNEQLNRELQGQYVPGEFVDKDLDGVMIKATSLPPAIKKAILKDSATPSPLRSPSPSRSPLETSAMTPQKPVTIEIAATQKILQLPSRELYTHAAGHTPLARVTDASEEGTGSTTPQGDTTIQVAEQEMPPLEPRPSTQDVKPIRPPNERGDSYFNVPVPQPAAPETLEEPLPPTTAWKPGPPAESKPELDNVPDYDPPLQGPLAMPNQPKDKSNDFLSKLDQRLTSLSKEQDSKDDASVTDSRAANRDSVDPPLRIKRSLNFGSAWGAGIAGRDA